jgi:hypothetical protein
MLMYAAVVDDGLAIKVATFKALDMNDVLPYRIRLG